MMFGRNATPPRVLIRGKAREDRGAALVEFALVLPLLALILFGTIEFAWTFSQHLDLRHGSREGARLAAVSYLPEADADQVEAIGAAVCSRMERVTGATVTIELVGANETGQGTVVVTTAAPLQQITGFMAFALDRIENLTSTAEMRLERPLEWDGTAATHECEASGE
jgi:Flp pilus assembly protein TadG